MNPPISRRAVTASLLAGAAALGTAGVARAAQPTTTDRSAEPLGRPVAPTIVLIHGAFADASTWSAVVERLQRQGHRVVAPALPLRGLTSDSAYIRSVLDSITGPIVLVGHSYGGAVISQAAADAPQVKALVYIAAFVPDIGESALQLTDKFTGSTLGQATATQYYPLPDGSQGRNWSSRRTCSTSSSRPVSPERPHRSWPRDSVRSHWPLSRSQPPRPRGRGSPAGT